jgi:hypothetical protein
MMEPIKSCIDELDRANCKQHTTAKETQQAQTESDLLVLNIHRMLENGRREIKTFASTGTQPHFNWKSQDQAQTPSS